MAPSRILILFNPRSGHKRVNFSEYTKHLRALGADIEIRNIGNEFNLEELLNDAKQFARVVIAGGDGTASTAAGILQNSGVPILVYPGGTANLLARNLKMPSSPKALAERTLYGIPRPTDLGILEYVRFKRREYLKKRFLKRPILESSEKIYFSIMAGCGFAARLISHALPLKAQFGEAAYWFSALRNLFPHRAHFQLKLDGKEVEVQGIGILIINFEKIQFDIKVVEGSHAGDGRFEIMIVKSRSLFGLIPVLWTAICERLGFERWKVPEIVDTYHATEIEIFSNPPLLVQFDGEVLHKSAHFKIRNRPGAALFVYGEGS